MSVEWHMSLNTPQGMPGKSWVLNICMNKLTDFLKARFTLRRSCIDLYGFFCDYVNIPKSFFSLNGPSFPTANCTQKFWWRRYQEPGRRNTEPLISQSSDEGSCVGIMCLQWKTWSEIIPHLGPKLCHQPEVSSTADVTTNPAPRIELLLLLLPPPAQGDFQKQFVLRDFFPRVCEDGDRVPENSAK